MYNLKYKNGDSFKLKDNPLSIITIIKKDDSNNSYFIEHSPGNSVHVIHLKVIKKHYIPTLKTKLNSLLGNI